MGYKGKTKFEVNPDLKKELDKFEKIDDFRIQAEDDKDREEEVFVDDSNAPKCDEKSDPTQPDDKHSSKSTKKSEDKKKNVSDEKRKSYGDEKRKSYGEDRRKSGGEDRKKNDKLKEEKKSVEP